MMRDPRLDPEPDFVRDLPYRAIIAGLDGDEEDRIEFARGVWRETQEERIREYDAAQDALGEEEEQPGEPGRPEEDADQESEPRAASDTLQTPPRTPDRSRRASSSPSAQPASPVVTRGGQTGVSPTRSLARRRESNRRAAADSDDESDGDEQATFKAKVVKGQAVSGDASYEPDPKALANLARGKFVPMYYFVDRVCKSASKRQAAAGVDGITFRVDGKSVNLSGDAIPTSAKGVLRDDELSYDEFHHAQNMLIDKMLECPKYPLELVDGLSRMFHALDRHKIREDVYGTLAVQRYACVVRMEWHARLNNKTIFDIGEISEHRLRLIHTKIVLEETKNENTELKNEVREINRWRHSLANGGAFLVGSRKRERLADEEDDKPRKSRASGVEGRRGRKSSVEASLRALVLCAVCLGMHADVAKCNSDTFWNGDPARCHRNHDNRLVNPQGRVLCLDWQRFGKCEGQGSKHVHECSGCGDRQHGACKCPLRQKD